MSITRKMSDCDSAQIGDLKATLLSVKKIIEEKAPGAEWVWAVRDIINIQLGKTYDYNDY